MFPGICLSNRRIACTLLLAVLLPTCLFAQQKKGDPRIIHLNSINNIDSVKAVADSLLKIAGRDNDNTLRGRVLSSLSYKFYKNGDEIRSLEYAKQGAAAAPMTDSVTYIRLRTLIAWMYSRRGDSKTALSTAFAALKVAEQHGWKRQQVECKICISDLFRPVKNAAQAIAYAKQAADESASLKDTSRYVNAISMLANAYSTNPRPNSQLPRAQEAKAVQYLEMLLAEPYVQYLGLFARANIMGNLGMFYQDQRRYDKAGSILLQAYDIAVKNHFVSLQKHDLRELMTVALAHKDYSKAVSYGEKAIAVQSDANSGRLLQFTTYTRLSQAYKGIGDFRNALKYSEKARDLNDSLLAEDQQRIAADLDKKYQADKKLLLASHNNKLLLQQRNYTLALSAAGLVVLLLLYRWLSARKKREAATLAEQHRQLEQLNDMKSRFYANISHELKTPLTLIMGPAEQLLSSGGAAGPQKAELQAIVRNSRKLLDIVNELLDLGKLGSGAVAVKPQPVQLAALIKVIFQGFSSAAAYKKIHYTLACSIADNIIVHLDRDKFEKIANNFLSNALKFTPAGKAVHVTAALRAGMISFSVEDNGDGISPEDEPHIFERYYQGRRGALAEGGTGIGLAIAREFAEMMGGTVTMENDHEHGVIFTAEVPYIPVTEQFAKTSDVLDDESLQVDMFATLSGKSVLVVEDHDEMAAYIRSILEPQYRVVPADNGITALQLLDKASSMPDLIVSDVMMPGMDGFTLLDKLKRHPQYFRIPVIMLTALSDSKNKMRALNTGVDDYLVKPFIAPELLARVGNLVGNAIARREVVTSAVVEEESTIVTAPHINDQHDEAPYEPSASDMVWLAGLEEAVRKFIGKTDLNLAMLSYELNISERQLFRRIKAITGLTPNRYIRTIRLQIAREAIESGKYRTIAEISYVAGFETPAYFSKLYKEHFGRDVSDLI